MHAVILTRNRYKFNHHLRLMPHDSFFILTSSMTSFIDIFKLPKVQTIHILDAKSVMWNYADNIDNMDTVTTSVICSTGTNNN